MDCSRRGASIVHGKLEANFDCFHLLPILHPPRLAALVLNWCVLDVSLLQSPYSEQEGYKEDGWVSKERENRFKMQNRILTFWPSTERELHHHFHSSRCSQAIAVIAAVLTFFPNFLLQFYKTHTPTQTLKSQWAYMDQNHDLGCSFGKWLD